MVACSTNINDSIEVSSLTRRSQYSTNATFKGCNLLGYSIIGRISQTSIEITAILQVKQTCHLLTGLISKSCTLINGQLLRFTFLRLPATMNTYRFKISFHIIISFIIFILECDCKVITKPFTIKIYCRIQKNMLSLPHISDKQ